MGNHFISVETAREYTARYREHKDNITTEAYKDALPNSESFDKATIQQILDQKDCVGMRIYYGLNERNEVCQILVGIDQHNEDILVNDLIAEEGIRCPPDCNATPL